ncbi:hypothetical protein F4775DRAFT_545238, partial [Biscogniauxia sp. FL1348]
MLILLGTILLCFLFQSSIREKWWVPGSPNIHSEELSLDLDCITRFATSFLLLIKRSLRGSLGHKTRPLPSSSVL